MPEYLAPGVYVEEIDSGPRPIEGVSTSTAGFVGVTEMGPTDAQPQLVTGVADFQRTYGGYLSETEWPDSWFLPHAVQGFFENGGGRLYVRRITGPRASPSAMTLPTGETEGRHAFIVTQLAEPADVNATEVKLMTARGLEAGRPFTLIEPLIGAPHRHEFTVVRVEDDVVMLRDAASRPSRGTDRAYSRRAIALLPLPVGMDSGPALSISAASDGTWGKSLRVTVVPSSRSTGRLVAWTGAIATVQGAFRPPASSGEISVIVDSAESLSQNMRVTVTHGSTTAAAEVTSVDRGIRTVGLRFDGRRPAFGANAIIHVESSAQGARARMSGARSFYTGAALEITDAANEKRHYARVTEIHGDEVELNPPLPPTFLADDRVRSVEFDLVVELVRVDPATRLEHVERQEHHTFLSCASEAFNFAPARLEAASQLIRATIPDPHTGNRSPFDQPVTVNPSTFERYRTLTGGNDGDAPRDSDYRAGLQALEDRDDIAIIAVPGISSRPVQEALIEQCERLRDRFAVLDSPSKATLDEVTAARRDHDTHYAAYYYPWIKVADPLRDGQLTVPPSGHVAGIYARTDVERGVHKAPANAVVRGALDLERLVDKRQQEILNQPPHQINVLRDFRSSGRGIRVWGARCITSDSNWKFVNVRRLFIFLEESLDQGTQWVTFEPNDERLWARVRQSIVDFLTGTWLNGALAGTSPDQAFFVRCDRTTMTQDDLASGRLIVIVGVAPVYPAEFVIIRIGQWTGSAAA